MNKRLLGLLLVASALTGCSVFNPGGSSEFDCPGMPKGVVCKTPRQVYDRTDSDTKKTGRGAAAPTYLFATEPRGKDRLNPVPVLEQAKVMRIWIAPWVDANKDLHWPGVMFTEVTPRKWNFGEEQFEGVEPPVPHRAFEQGVAPAKTPAAASGKNGAADQPVVDETLN